jgi:ketosteroid isomerase-like protein
MNTEQNKQAVQEAYRMFQNGDIRSIVESCHDDAEWCSPDSDFMPMSGTFHGKQGVAEFFARMGGAMQPTRFEPREFIAEGDKVVVIGQATWQVKSNGRSFDTPWVHLFTMRDGKIARFEAFADTAAGERAFRPDQGVQAQASPQLRH